MTSQRRAALLSGAWAAGTIIALAVTLPAVGTDKDFDGLNNALQIPFALPWFLLPVATSDRLLDAWIAAGMGLVNAALIYRWLSRRSAHDQS